MGGKPLKYRISGVSSGIDSCDLPWIENCYRLYGKKGFDSVVEFDRMFWIIRRALC